MRFLALFFGLYGFLGLNGNSFSLLHFKEGSLILDSYFKF
jgi:hypothetical protein